jgi:acyl-CoA thioester hydrolase
MASDALIEVARYRVIFADCDPMRIMYNGSYLRLVEIGWTELLRKLGHAPSDYIERGLFLAVIESRCRYIKPACYDDVLCIRAGVSAVRPERFIAEYEITHEDGDVLARFTTQLAVVNEKGRPQRIPEDLAAAAASIVPK